ncbi:tRNA uridine-5-carboxymethylaminomethyl(34) synthesis GTPase MnmE [Ferribacterium limneticum]|uniref:tRNA uridine-5-carboxymethylaminomethyl(34) synthesis GTPase MnmE n=1 Tax=Ferribacterium limneticum TaxID=76259 RepID=UPI001CFB636A|nr:tRNA uridine-5-carboxymethylaminomethyl(34) synthesis GTPase MnmE [Ferribacterium limneticum]UCV28535.1 tRNA uridine-5-carboxymethylaminomethyl(34) synthesis GTPase MnmE [Ferribacterium limneticum]UCV32452.1 tRNA uridine-5-carboxymethylaminomethyl(34) synthesis GTPase MnmE [Ferribacterium limneticum]
MKSDTIAAIATAPGRGGVGVIRISGSNLLPFAFALTEKTPKPRYASLADFKATDGSTIDTGLLLYFPNPQSFTGEDVLELQGHGGPVVMQMLLARCLDLGARLAEPGEFSRRAFLNGKMDLAQAEAVADLIDAATASAARSAVRSLQGEFSRAIGELNDELINLRMLVEATLDFPEEDIDFLKAANAFGRLERLQLKLAEIFDRAGQGKLLQSGLHVVLAGQPNVGKSSLLNRLAGDDLAIVTPIAGTTRDALRSTIQIEGIPLHIIDTAGLRETDDEVEKIGIERSWKEIERSDVVLLLVDARTGVGEADREILARLPERLQRITVYNKIDLAGREAERHDEADGIAISLSAKANQGIELLRQELLRIAGWHQAEDVFIARERHLRALANAQEHLAAARNVVEGAMPALELFAEELRLTQQSLGEITGEFTADDLLGVIFSRFCIGK